MVYAYESNRQKEYIDIPLRNNIALAQVMMKTRRYSLELYKRFKQRYDDLEREERIEIARELTYLNEQYNALRSRVDNTIMIDKEDKA